VSTRALVDGILRREGAQYSNHPADRGGPTKYGITLERLQAWRRRPTFAADVEQLAEGEAREIYLSEYFTAPSFDRINDERLQELVVDCGVNHGVDTAAKWIQSAAAVATDGKLGPVSLAAINGGNQVALYLRVLAARVRIYGRLVTNDPKLADLGAAAKGLQAQNAAGWNNRAAEFIDALAREVVGEG
jgi:lysozyme family protein